jgi:PiT family inorganic phosphate transporter
MDPLGIIILIIALALVFDFLNGMNDAANSIATVVSTRVLSPTWAVAWAAFFNFAAVFVFGTAVAKTVGTGIVDVGVVDNAVAASALVGGSIWVWVCTHYGMPISVSHSLLGGIVGAGVAKAGWGAVVVSGVSKVCLFILLSPLIGGILAFLLIVANLWIVRRQPPRRVNGAFRILQLLSSAFYSLGHGSNDAQKVAGWITALLIANGHVARDAPVPIWVLMMCYTVIGLGTLTGGWRVIRTLGVRVTKLQPIGGFCAEAGAGLTLVGTALFGIPVSTTHSITGSIIGVGATQRLSAVRWGVARNIVIAWVTTIPASALMAALCQRLISAVS